MTPADLTKADILAAFGMPPKDAIAYLEGKGLRFGWNWQDTLDQAHARSFTVAKVARMDVLRELRSAVVNVAKTGQTEAQFIKTLTPELQRLGWWGKQVIVDSQGNAERVQMGSPRRLSTIYRTNMQSAYMAGHYKNGMQAIDTHPYWEWVAILDGKTRAAHRALDGTIFAMTDGFTRVAWPPVGYNCRCIPNPISRARLKERGVQPTDTSGLLQTRQVDLGVDKATGEMRTTTVQGFYKKGPNGKDIWVGPDAGFNASPASSHIMDELLVQRAQKLQATYAPKPGTPGTPATPGAAGTGAGKGTEAAAKALRQAQAVVTSPARQKAWKAFVANSHDFGKPQNQSMTVGILQAAEIQHAQSLGLEPPNPVIFVEDRLIVGKKAQRHQADGDALTREQWESLPVQLAQAKAVYWDKPLNAFVYAMRSNDTTTEVLVVRVTDKKGSQAHAPVAASGYQMKTALIKEKLLKGSYVRVR